MVGFASMSRNIKFAELHEGNKRKEGKSNDYRVGWYGLFNIRRI